MKQLNIDKVFSIFKKDNDSFPVHAKEVRDNPFVQLGETTRGVVNYFLIDQIYTNRKVPGYSEKRDVIKYRFFSKVYSYLEDIDMEEVSRKFKIGETFEVEESIKILNFLLKYFESFEDYEKCATILKYVKLLEKSRKTNISPASGK